MLGLFAKTPTETVNLCTMKEPQIIESFHSTVSFYNQFSLKCPLKRPHSSYVWVRYGCCLWVPGLTLVLPLALIWDVQYPIIIIMGPHCMTWWIFSENSQKTPHSSPWRVSYGVSFVGSKSALCLIVVIPISYRWFSARLQYLQCISNVDNSLALSHWYVV